MGICTVKQSTKQYQKGKRSCKKKVAVDLGVNVNTVDSLYNEPRRKVKNSSLYREFVKLKIEKKSGIFAQTLNLV